MCAIKCTISYYVHHKSNNNVSDLHLLSKGINVFFFYQSVKKVISRQFIQEIDKNGKL